MRRDESMPRNSRYNYASVRVCIFVVVSRIALSVAPTPTWRTSSTASSSSRSLLHFRPPINRPVFRLLTSVPRSSNATYRTDTRRRFYNVVLATKCDDFRRRMTCLPTALACPSVRLFPLYPVNLWPWSFAGAYRLRSRPQFAEYEGQGHDSRSTVNVIGLYG